MAKHPGNSVDGVKLIVGMLHPSGSGDLLEWGVRRLAETFGDMERKSPPYPFVYTDYYRNISPELTRRFFTFAGLRHPFGLVVWKKLAISIEAESMPGGAGRKVNIDPGYMDGAKLVLASTKNNAHRIYLWDDIFAETTLCYRKSGWESFSYTFPDFACGVYDEFLNAARADWKRDIRASRSGKD
ncbi:MAG: DUF4416 family protein [Synergistaceae bacterium]|jgi:hypothetical protein|nr:DUF4416 family protein [Synergistaceae bacterium]